MVGIPGGPDLILTAGVKQWLHLSPLAAPGIGRVHEMQVTTTACQCEPLSLFTLKRRFSREIGNGFSFVLLKRVPSKDYTNKNMLA